MLKLILKIFVLILAVIVGLVLLGFLFKLVSLIVSLAIGLLILAGFVYLIGYLLKLGARTEQSRLDSFTVFNYSHPAVVLFTGEPSVRDLVNVQSDQISAERALDGSIIEIENNTQVIVLEDRKEKDAVRVRVAGGRFNGQTGWVCRSVLRQPSEQKLIDG